MLRGLPCIARFHESASPESIAVPIQVEGDGENPAFIQRSTAQAGGELLGVCMWWWWGGGSFIPSHPYIISLLFQASSLLDCELGKMLISILLTLAQ